MQNKILRVALIGVGNMGKKYAQMIVSGEVANMKLTAVVIRRDELMEYGCQGWLDYDRSWPAVHSLFLHLVRTQLCDQESRQRGPDVHG